MLSETAEKRLKAIEEFTELGAGFKLAMRDLEIRGAGNLLGSQQHGNIASVGFALYCSMLEEAIAKAQHKTVTKTVEVDPVIDLGIDAFIDEAYINDTARKITIYQRLLQIRKLEDFDEFTDELIDRFGSPTPPVERLLKLARIKERAMVIREGVLIIHWADLEKMAGWDPGLVATKVWQHVKIDKNNVLRYSPIEEGASVLTTVEVLMGELEKRDPALQSQ